MDIDLREALRGSLRTLAASQAATITHMEQMYELLRQFLVLDPLDYFLKKPTTCSSDNNRLPMIDWARLSVTFRERTCFLGNTLPFRLLSRLAVRPNTFVSHEDLLAEVWQGTRSDAAIRSVVKTLRQKLRRAGLLDLAVAIDGSQPGYYVLRLPT
jgi:DNA-binding response OmpR family regulator